VSLSRKRKTRVSPGVPVRSTGFSSSCACNSRVMGTFFCLAPTLRRLVLSAQTAATASVDPKNIPRSGSATLKATEAP